MGVLVQPLAQVVGLVQGENLPVTEHQIVTWPVADGGEKGR